MSIGTTTTKRRVAGARMTIKTRVYKAGMRKWRTDFLLPYSGRLYIDSETWQDAMHVAWNVEEQREWM